MWQFVTLAIFCLVIYHINGVSPIIWSDKSVAKRHTILVYFDEIPAALVWGFRIYHDTQLQIFLVTLEEQWDRFASHTLLFDYGNEIVGLLNVLRFIVGLFFLQNQPCANETIIEYHFFTSSAECLQHLAQHSGNTDHDGQAPGRGHTRLVLPLSTFLHDFKQS